MTKKAAKLVKKTTSKKPKFDPDTATIEQADKHYKNHLEFAQWVFNRFFHRYASQGDELNKQDMRYFLREFGYNMEDYFGDESM